MATDFFLNIDGIPGESTAAYARGQIDVHSMSFGVTQPTAVGRTGQGQTTGKAAFGEIHFTKYTDKASPMLYQIAGSGRHIPKAVFTGWKSSERPTMYFKVTLSDVVVTSFQNAGAGGSEMTEQLSFSYSNVEFEYIEQKADGSTGATNKASFDVRQNQTS